MGNWISINKGVWIKKIEGVEIKNIESLPKSIKCHVTLKVNPIDKRFCSPVDRTWDWEWAAYACIPTGEEAVKLAYGNAMTKELAQSAAEETMK